MPGPVSGSGSTRDASVMTSSIAFRSAGKNNANAFFMASDDFRCHPPKDKVGAKRRARADFNRGARLTIYRE